MAIKDWKKTRKDTWFNKKRSIRLEINKGKTKEQWPYLISIHSTFIVAGGEKTLKGTKTKAQALKFAKSYMRKN